MGTGILHPWISHQFMVTFDALPNSMISNQVVSVKFDLIKKKVFIDFEVPIVFEDFIKEIEKLLALEVINITISKPEGTLVPIFGLANCKVENAGFDLDYSIRSSVVKVHTEFLYSGLITSSGLTVVEINK